MARNEDSGSPGWSASFFKQTTEDVARAVVAAAAAATTVRSPRPSVVFSSKDDNKNSQLQKLQRQVTKVLKGFSPPSEERRGTYNPEVLTSQKRQWASSQLQSLDHRSVKEPSRLFENMVVVGLHPNSDIQALQKQIFARKSGGSGKLRSALSGQHQTRVEPNLEPQVLFVYPPEKQLPLNSKDLLSFCFPGGLEVHAVERTPSMSELNEILLGQEHLKQSDLSFVFRLQIAIFGNLVEAAVLNTETGNAIEVYIICIEQVADDSTLYGCCVLVEETVQKPSGLISMISDKQPFYSSLSRHILTTRRCYCILSRLPCFDLHFGVLNSIFTEERLERLTKDIGMLDLESQEGYNIEEDSHEKSDGISPKHTCAVDMLNGPTETSEISTEGSTPRGIVDDESHLEHQMLEGGFDILKDGISSNVPVTSEMEILTAKTESGVAMISNAHDICVDEFMMNKQMVERPDTVLPLLRYHQYESSESSISFQSSPSEDRNFRSEVDETEMEEASSSGREDSSDLNDVLEWAKANNHGSLQIICEYDRLHCPSRGTTLTFHPLDHLYPLEFHRHGETVLHIGGSTIDLRSCSTSLEFAEAHSALSAEEEATALSVWTVACICGSLRLENVLTMFAGALLEKQIVIVCSNLGILSASVLSIVPLIRPYQWQCLLMPVLPNDMLDFLDAPVPYVVGVKNKTSEVQSKLTNAILVDANKNQVCISS
ncbi:hypothetical protein HHK36_005911 [Tetracentron sinense]|uniref:UDENN domain-containing protein n=1 Tax=Tetracentron sinense TaxID=13715 RepID=A0A834Y976_TETSI|nr:hypothetical protein HHK36_031829 [Tetracentron sinense]KAF8406790.1 hypothetical protein HHK36_005911 [Tetracentron sinense]